MFKFRNLFYIQQRWKSGKQRWSIQQRKKTNSDRALESFDDFYGSVYGLRWRNMRAALLSEHKYIAIVNNFGDTEKTCSELELDGAVNVKTLIQLSNERLRNKETAVSTDDTYKMDAKLSELVRRQEQREKQSIYPEIDRLTEEPAQLPEHLHYGAHEVHNSQSTNTVKLGGSTAAEKSLTQALESDLHIDRNRLVDPQYGTGGLYEYVPASRIKGMEDWIPESDHYKYYQTNVDFPLKFEIDTEFTFPENLCLYTYEMGNCSLFKTPKRTLTGVLSHFLMDGASILPPLLLNVQHGDHVLDACAAPGGKSLLMLQTLHPELIVCNDIQESRVNRIRKVMHEYLFDFEKRFEGKRIALTESDARHISAYDSYDKILVDVPCTTDRHCLNKNDNNIFKPTRVKERLRIPELQAAILTNCLRLLKPGGSLVYATCSLSPVQNDGVVHMALQQAFSEYGLTATISDLSKVIRSFEDIFHFEHSKGLKYGQMVIPFLPANYGPMYFSKLTRDA